MAEQGAGYTTAAIDDLPTVWDGWAKLVRAGLGISGFGVQIVDYPPDYRTKSHDESASGQEELYLALRGGGEVLIGPGEERVPLDPEHLVLVRPETERTLATGPDGLRVLCVGGAPGRPYTPPEWTEES
jgi:hypothetical protein